ncbi:hypothetical protein LY78DRAFT_181481 [Colletotrichum sublineola]|nr:hypothetical protein LY78DRAFT_181481 [Colletotrichum sublineola]
MYYSTEVHCMYLCRPGLFVDISPLAVFPVPIRLELQLILRKSDVTCEVVRAAAKSLFSLSVLPSYSVHTSTNSNLNSCTRPLHSSECRRSHEWLPFLSRTISLRSSLAGKPRVAEQLSSPPACCVSIAH